MPVLLVLIALIIISVEVVRVEFSTPMKHPENTCTCSRDRRCGCKMMLIVSARSADQMSSPEIFLGGTLTAPVPDVEKLMMSSSPNLLVRSVRRSVKMSEFAVTSEISFRLLVFSVAL